MKNYVSERSPISHKYLNHGKCVPIQKCSKFKPSFYTFMRTYTTLSNNSSLNNISFVKKYENAYSTRKEIYKENLGKSGIYMFTNKLTNDIYVGQSKDLSKRFKNYFNLSYIKSKENLKISKAIIKYGYLNFSMTILEYCDKSNLMGREQYYLDKLNPQYNILKVRGSSLNSKFSKEANTKKTLIIKRVEKKSDLISSFHTKETRELIDLEKTKENKPLFKKVPKEENKEFIKKVARKPY